MLEECNRLEIGVQINDPVGIQQMVKQVREIVRQTFPKETDSLDLNDDHIRKVLQQWASVRLTSLQRLVEGDFQFLWVLPDLKDVNVDASVDLDKLVDALNRIEFNEEQLLSTLREFGKENNLKVKTLMMTIRSLLSARKEGPGIHEMMSILGKKTTIERLQRFKSNTTSR